MQPPAPISAYVLAGGRSSRMGTDKSLLQLAGKPLIQHAVEKLRRLTPDVQILSSNPTLAPYAPLLPDIHPNTGPIGGLEAALTHTTTDWNLILPVDTPFLPANLLDAWLIRALAQQAPCIHLVSTEDGRPQPTLCLLHREVLPYLSQSIASGDYRLMQAFQFAAASIAANLRVPPPTILSITPLNQSIKSLTVQQCAAQSLWFANLNTPFDFTEAEAHIDALDP